MRAVLSLSLAAAAAAAADLEYAPAFLWSPKQIQGLGRAVERHAASSEAELERAFGALAGGARSALLDGGMASGEAPEVQLIFLADGLLTGAVREHGALLSNVHTLLNGAASSLTVPFTTQSPATLFAGAPRVLAAEAEAFLAARPELFTNGKTDVVVVELSARPDAAASATLAAHDEHVGRVCKLAHERAGGNYAALLTASAGNAAFHPRKLQELAPAATAAAASVVYLRTTPTLLTAQLVSLMLITIFLSGFCCLFNLQTPKRFEEVKAA